jgi:DNA transformation protein
MSTSPEYLDYLRELFAPLGTIRTRRMFGGAGVYCDEVFFALVIDDVLFLKADEQTRADFERAGLEPFCYEAEGRRVTLSYYRAPDEARDSPALMQPWAHAAMGAALRARHAKPAPRKRPKTCP